MIKLAVGGALGRMGQALLTLAKQDQRFEVSAEYDKNTGLIGAEFDVLVDFSLPEGTMQFVNLCLNRSAALIIGTTGFTPSQEQIITESAAQIPILRAANFSLGINWLLKSIPQIAGELSKHYDIEIVETHHTRKLDAPSGTALSILSAVQKATDHSNVIYGRHGLIGAKESTTIGVHAIRSGDVVGKHEIIFGGLGESITITHEARSRDTFAHGALQAAAWLENKPPGLYSMLDIMK